MIWLCLFAFFAGFIDSIAGGGGLIQLPAVFVFLPQLVPGTLGTMVLGTNKFSSVFGTALATARYIKQVPVKWSHIAVCACFAAVLSYVGARSSGLIPDHILRYGVAFLLVAVGMFTLFRPEWGTNSASPLQLAGWKPWLAAVLVGSALGFYDGIFGPGTGTFLIFAFVGLFRFDFLSASAAAKLVNLVTNIFALVFFVGQGHVAYEIAIPMAAANMTGAYIGTHVALTRGTRFVRLVVLAVVFGLVVKLCCT